MEDGTNEDQNFYSRRPLPRSPEQQQQHRQPPQTPPDLSNSSSISPESEHKISALTTANLQAVTANGFEIGLSPNGEPDEFYREYRGVQQASNEHTEITADGMTAMISDPRSVPSTSSNSNGTAPRNPTLPVLRNNLKPANRSASAPVNDKSVLENAKSSPALNGKSQTGKPSVKDLLKRFDQNNSEPSPSAPRKSAPRLVTKESPSSSHGHMRDRVGDQPRTASASNLHRNGTSRTGGSSRNSGSGGTKSPTAARPSPYARPTPENQRSETLSGVARATRPGSAVSGNSPKASKSMINLPPISPTSLSKPPARKPLFGEILPVGQEASGVGYGISQATCGTSESSLDPSGTQPRSKSSLDISPSSPTAWYLGVTPALEDVDPNKAPHISPAHNRNHSDPVDTRVRTTNSGDTSSPATSASNAQMHEAAKSASRLPLSTKRRSTPSNSSSPTSTGSSSPFSSRTPVNTKRKSDQRPWSPAGRAMTTTTRTTPPGSTTAPTSLSPRKAKSPRKLNTNSSSLKAYISAPPPKTSPPLRSSRPRLPVSSASTVSSRSRAADGSGSPQQVRSGMKITRNGGSNEPKPRKIVDSGPVDFAARRERIQRAYTKSIHESEQREIRAANMRRLNEREAQETAGEESREGDEMPEVPLPTESVPDPAPTAVKPLQITTSFSQPQEGRSLAGPDSPTLGMPGTFLVDDEEPASAMTDATGTTEFDNEQQTEAPQLNRMSAAAQFSEAMVSSSLFQWDDLSAEQASFSVGHSLRSGPNSIEGSPNTSPAEEHQPDHTPTNDIFEPDPLPPGAFRHYSVQYDQPIPATTTTAAGPEQIAEHHGPVDSLQSIDQTTGNVDSSAQEVGTSQIHPPPQILFHPESETADSSALLGISSAPQSLDMNDVHDYLNTPVTELDYESSDGYGANASEPEVYEASYEQKHDIQSSTRIYRSSHQSSWTNDSVETAESSGHGDYSSPPLQSMPEPERKPTPPPKSQPSPGIPPKPENYSPQPSPVFATETPRRASSNARPAPLSTDSSFRISFSDPAPVPLIPPYSPPPPPVPRQLDGVQPIRPTRSPPPPIIYNNGATSSLPPSNHNNTSRNTESPRASGDFYSPRPSISTPRSSAQISSVESTANQSFGSKDVLLDLSEEDKKAAEKLRKRLFQRRMLIKELIDTESVYLKDMNVVEEIYKGTAEACPKLDSNDIKAIFRNTDEIVAFSTIFLDELKSAGSSVYSPRSQRKGKATPAASTAPSPSIDDRFSVAPTFVEDSDDQKDRRTFIGANFGKHLKKMQTIYTDYLKNSENASARLASLQADSAVKVWLSECNLVAKDLTAAWDLDALLVKPVQRITRYQLLLAQIFEHTSEDHPDWPALRVTVDELAKLLKNIDDLKKRIQMVGKIVGRKRKESDVRSGIAKAFGRRTDKLQAVNMARPHDDDVYLRLYERFGHDFLRLQVVLRDVEFYTREITIYVRKFLEYLSSIELVMRISASTNPEIESKWVRFNVSMRDIGTVALEDHLALVRSKVIEPFESVIQSYGPPSLAIKKRNKRRLDYEKYLSLKSQGKKIDDKLADMVDQYEALNETLKLELPKLSTLTESVGNACLVQFVDIQTAWYGIWQDKLRTVLEEDRMPKDIADMINMFAQEFTHAEALVHELGIVNGYFLTGIATSKGRVSESTQSTSDPKGRPSNLSSRSRGLSVDSDNTPSLPTPDFERHHRHSGQFVFSPIAPTPPEVAQSAHQAQSHSQWHTRNGSMTLATPDATSTFGNRSQASNLARPNTGRSYTSESGAARPSTDYNSQHRRESGSTSTSGYHHVDGPPQSTRPYSGLFNSAMPLPDGPEDSQRSSRASSRDRNVSGGYNVLYLAASLFEFNIEATKSEAGYPYLTYDAGEIFDVIGEKGELWLAKNQDDPSDQVGWIWSKHFARLAT